MADGSRSSFQIGTPVWARVLLPSAADLIFIALMGSLVFTPLSVRLLGDAGIGWHIRTGQLILSTRSVPRVDPFSSTMGGTPWYAWEWLYDLAVGHLDATIGLNGVVWLTAVAIAATFAWTFQLLLRRRTNLFAALFLVLLEMSASTIHFLARPHVMSWLLALAWFWVLDSTAPFLFRGEMPRHRRLWLLPLLMLLWVNVHGGFVVGFVLLGIYWLGALWTRLSVRDGRIEELIEKISAGRRLRDLSLVALLSMAASLLNPYGWKLHAHIYSYLTNRFLMGHIDEFQSPNFHALAPRCFLTLLLIAIPILVARGRELRLPAILVVLFAVYSALYASRNIPISSILLVMVIGPLLPAGWKIGFSQRMIAIDSTLRGHVWPILMIFATLLIASNGGRAGSTQWMDAHFDPKRMPVEAVNYIEKSAPATTVLSPDYWGGYLIYRLYPKTHVVIDDRHDFYGERFVQSYLQMLHVERGWQDFLTAHQPACVLLPRDSALANILAQTPGWKQIYADDVAVALIRDPARISLTR